MTSFLPLELLEKIIGENADDFKSIHFASRVSKSWRAASLRHLFSRASFHCKADFRRWQTIGECLPHVPKYVRHVHFSLGPWNYNKRIRPAANMPSQSWGSLIFLPLAFFGLGGAPKEDDTFIDYDFPGDYEFPLSIPVMPNATKLTWNQHERHIVCNSRSENAERFMRSFPSIRTFHYHDSHNGVFELQHILSFFPLLKSCLLLSVSDEARAGGFETYTFSGNLSHLKELKLSESSMLMDWMTDELIQVSPPPIRKFAIDCGPIPFTRDGFSDFLDRISPTLEELSLESHSGSGLDYSWRDQAPNFLPHTMFPNLHAMAFKLSFYNTSDLQASLKWTAETLRIFPPSPKVASIAFSVYVSDPQDIVHKMFRVSHWDALTGNTSRWPALNTFSLEILMEYEFEVEEKTQGERAIRQNLGVMGSKLVVYWTLPPIGSSL